MNTGWRICIGCLMLQVIFRKRATNSRALLRKTTCNEKASSGSLPPGIYRHAFIFPWDMLSLKTTTLSQQNPVYAAYHRVHFCEHIAHANCRPTNSSVIFRRWSWCGKHAASARAWLRETNAERSHVIFPCESAVCSSCNNIEEFAI